MLRSSEVLARDFGFREAIATRDAATIGSALESLKGRSQTGAAFVITLEREVLSFDAMNIEHLPGIWYRVDERKTHGIVDVDGKDGTRRRIANRGPKSDRVARDRATQICALR